MMSPGYILLDPVGKVISMNQKAREILPRIPGLVPDLRQVDLEILRQIVNGRQTLGESEPVEILVETLANGLPAPTHLLLTLRAWSPPSERRRHMLFDRFRMTRAEVRLAEMMMDGHSPATAAEALGITIHTVRTYLKRLYTKLGVRSQSTLVRKLMHAEMGLQ